MPNLSYQKTVVIDFDNTIAGYDHWRGPKVMGPPVPYAKEAIEEYREWGWRVVIFTTRGNADQIRTWLKEYGFPDLWVNSNAHNPPDTSCKPIAEVYHDDRDGHCVGCIPYNWHRAMARVRRRYQPRIDTFVDDAAAWACPWERYLVAPFIRRNYAKRLPKMLDAMEAIVQ